MEKLTTIQKYSVEEGICERTIYRKIKNKELKSIKIGTERYLVMTDLIDEETAENILLGKKEEWNEEIKRANIIYRQNGGACKKTGEIISEIMRDVERTEKIINQKIRGYDRRSLQGKIKSGKTERKTRADKFKIRNRNLKQDETFIKAMELIERYWIQDPLHSLSNAIDRAIYEAKNNEQYWEVAAVNYYTLRRQVNQVIRQSGLRDIHEYMNHLNLNRKRNAYVQGAFTDDVEFMEVYSLDDHKFDVAGAWVFNERTGQMEQKKIYSWMCIEMKTMKILGYEIKAEPFQDSDIIRMMMKVIRKWGAPKGKVICDQGLGADRWVREFFNKAGIILEPQAAYSPTKKANNERIYKFFKEEIDIYCENFTGSEHPTEGRHRGLELSPEQTTELMSEAIKRYDKYISTYYEERPRQRDIKGIEEIKDNTGRVSIRALYEHYNQQHKKIEIKDRLLRYAYMKDDYVKGFDGYYMKFKGEIYIEEDEAISLAIYDRAYKYQIAYNPDDMNTIDLYAIQDIMDRITGRMIEKGEYVCTLNAIRALDYDEKRKAVTKHNKKIKKAILELASALRETKETVNMAINGDGKLIDIKKQEEKAIADILRNSIPIDRIANILEERKAEVTFENIEEMNLDGLENIDV